MLGLASDSFFTHGGFFEPNVDLTGQVTRLLSIKKGALTVSGGYSSQQVMLTNLSTRTIQGPLYLAPMRTFARLIQPRPVGYFNGEPYIRLDADILQSFRSTGAGWQTRLNDALRDWLRSHAS